MSHIHCIMIPCIVLQIPVFQRGGTIIPKKLRVRRASSLMANDPYTLIVALDAEVCRHGNDPYTCWDDYRNQFLRISNYRVSVPSPIVTNS